MDSIQLTGYPKLSWLYRIKMVTDDHVDLVE